MIRRLTELLWRAIQREWDWLKDPEDEADAGVIITALNRILIEAAKPDPDVPRIKEYGFKIYRLIQKRERRMHYESYCTQLLHLVIAHVRSYAEFKQRSGVQAAPR